MMKVAIISLFFSVFITSCSSFKNTSFLVGTYTDNKNQGINKIDFNTKTNLISLNQVILGVENPSFVIANRNKTIIVTVEETASKKGGKVTSFLFDKSLNIFKKITSVFTNGDHPCSVAFSPNEDFVVVGNYSGGNLSIFSIDKFGKLSEALQIIDYEGKSENTSRQESPHVHCIVFHPLKNKIFVTDLGTDSIHSISYSSNSNGFLQATNTISTTITKGSGPRHLVFNKQGTKAFVTLELTNEIGFFEYKDSQLQLMQVLNLTDDKTKNGTAAEVKLSKDEKFLYASVRGNDNFIAVMKFDESNKLKIIQKVSTGKAPRNFILSNNDASLLVANQDSNTISVFNRDKKTGLLTAISSEFTINKPVYFCEF